MTTTIAPVSAEMPAAVAAPIAGVAAAQAQDLVQAPLPAVIAQPSAAQKGVNAMDRAHLVAKAAFVTVTVTVTAARVMDLHNASGWTSQRMYKSPCIPKTKV
jgi:hypothetical protein